MAKIKPLRDCQLFNDLDDRALALFSKVVDEKPLTAGSTLFTEGMRGESMYLVVSGSVKISKLVSEGDEQVLGVMRPGEFFGEMALMSPGPRPATAITMEPTVILIIKRSALKSLEETAPQVGLAVIWAVGEHFGAQLRDHAERYKEILFNNGSSVPPV